MARIEYDDDYDFFSDTTEFEMYESEEAAQSAIAEDHEKNSINGMKSSMGDEKCRRRKPCRIRRCWIENGRRVCSTITTYCCVE